MKLFLYIGAILLCFSALFLGCNANNDDSKLKFKDNLILKSGFLPEYTHMGSYEYTNKCKDIVTNAFNSVCCESKLVEDEIYNEGLSFKPFKQICS